MTADELGQQVARNSESIDQNSRAIDSLAALPIRAIVLRWMLVQRIDTVLLLVIIALLYQGWNYAVTTAIPAHLQQIQAGYERISDQNAKDIRNLEATFEKMLDLERKRAGLPALSDRQSNVVSSRLICGEGW